MYGLLQTLIANDVRTDLRELVALAAGVQPIACGRDVQAAVRDFAARRLEQLLLDRGAFPALSHCAAWLGGSGCVGRYRPADFIGSVHSRCVAACTARRCLVQLCISA